MKYLDDDAQSIGMLLADAHRLLRANTPIQIEVKGELLPSQFGALLNFAQHSQVTLGPKTLAKLATRSSFQLPEFDNPADDYALSLLKSWLDDDDHEDESAISVGFWLSRFFLRQTGERLAPQLTQLLAGQTIGRPVRSEKKIVRRYPTGGISEKQALILPALLHSISDEFEIASFFIIAGLLAHTGGTRAKLSIFPDFEALHAADIAAIDFHERPINYISASKSVCPRDAILYRKRSETGTVEDHDLMVSSIMSKQVAVPSDAIVIDVLYGEHSFLKTAEDATLFGAECGKVADQFGLSLKCTYRADTLFLPRSIGASTEVLEAYEILSNCSTSNEEIHPSTELGIALKFIGELLAKAGMGSAVGVRTARDKLRSGAARESFIKLLLEHGVDASWLNEFQAQPEHVLTGSLTRRTLTAHRSGRVKIDYPALADLVNSKINLSQYSGIHGFEVQAGGIRLCVEHGHEVKKASKIMDIYSSAALADTTFAAIAATLRIE